MERSQNKNKSTVFEIQEDNQQSRFTQDKWGRGSRKKNSTVREDPGETKGPLSNKDDTFTAPMSTAPTTKHYASFTYTSPTPVPQLASESTAKPKTQSGGLGSKTVGIVVHRGRTLL